MVGQYAKNDLLKSVQKPETIILFVITYARLILQNQYLVFKGIYAAYTKFLNHFSC